LTSAPSILRPPKGLSRRYRLASSKISLNATVTLQERGYQAFALEPVGGTPLCESDLPENSAFVLGHEENGLSFHRADYPDIRNLSIPQSGVVESLNVSVAASIITYEYARRCRKGP